MTSRLASASYYDPVTRTVVVDNEAVRRQLTPITGQLLVVSITGPYQNGKSSFISFLTGDTTVVIGNGVEAETRGIWLYGPYSLNALKARWHVPEAPGDQTQVIFIDTEGFEADNVGFTHDENMLVMSQMIAPYLAISSVAILMHPKNIERGAIDTLRYLIDLTQRISAGANSSRFGGNNMTTIDICSSLPTYPGSQIGNNGRPVQESYDGTPESFELASQYVRSVQIQRFTGGNTSQMPIDHFWPLPSFNGDYDIFHQSDRFNQGFSLVAKRLLNILDVSKQQHAVDGQGVFTAFERLVRELTNENVEELTRICRELQEATAAERFLAPVIEEYVSTAKSQIKSEYWKLVKNIRTNPKRSAPAKSATEIADQCLRQIDECPGVNPTVLRSPTFVTKKENIRLSLVDFDGTCLIRYDALLEKAHERILTQKLKAFFIEETTHARGVMHSVLSSFFKDVNIGEMIQDVKARWHGLMDKTKNELGISLTLCSNFEVVFHNSLKDFEKDIRAQHDQMAKERWQLRLNNFFAIVSKIFRFIRSALGFKESEDRVTPLLTAAKDFFFDGEQDESEEEWNAEIREDDWRDKIQDEDPPE